MKVAEGYKTLELAERRLGILLGLKVSNKKKIEKVCAKMDEIRKKLTPKSKGFDGIAEIRRWREIR